MYVCNDGERLTLIRTKVYVASAENGNNFAGHYGLAASLSGALSECFPNPRLIAEYRV